MKRFQRPWSFERRRFLESRVEKMGIGECSFRVMETASAHALHFASHCVRSQFPLRKAMMQKVAPCGSAAVTNHSKNTCPPSSISKSVMNNETESWFDFKCFIRCNCHKIKKAKVRGTERETIASPRTIAARAQKPRQKLTLMVVLNLQNTFKSKLSNKMHQK